MNEENYQVLSDGLPATASQADPSQDRATRRATKNVMRPVLETQRKGAKSLSLMFCPQASARRNLYITLVNSLLDINIGQFATGGSPERNPSCPLILVHSPLINI